MTLPIITTRGGHVSRLGYKPAPLDPSAPKIASILPRLSLAAVSGDAYEIPLHRLPRSQVGGSCTANAICGAFETLSDCVGTPEPELGAHGLYWCERQQDGDTDQDSGSFLSTGLRCATAIGIGPESAWPQSEATLFLQPDAGYFVDAQDHRAAAYFAIESLDEAEVAVRASHPVCFGVQVAQELVDYDGDPSRAFDAPASPLGGHAMYIVGVGRDSNGARVWTARTSWGAFGINSMGTLRMSESYLQTATELYALTRQA